MPTKKLLAIRLYFQGPFHIGRGKPELAKSKGLPSSDGLKAALYANALQLFSEKEVDAVFRLGDLRLSAALPATEQGDMLPVPFTGVNCRIGDSLEDFKLQKKLRKLRYLPKQVFEKVLAGETITADSIFQPSFSSESIAQRVHVPPVGTGEDATPFHIAHTRIHAGNHLYFLAEGVDREAESMISATLKFMEDEGLGKGRGTGLGVFRVSLEREWILRVPEETGNWCLMGSHLPGVGQWGPASLQGGAWALALRGGFVASGSTPNSRSLRRKSIYLFEPGTVLPHPGPPVGSYIDLRPDAMAHSHPVWRDGRTISFPIRLNPKS